MWRKDDNYMNIKIGKITDYEVNTKRDAHEHHCPCAPRIFKYPGLTQGRRPRKSCNIEQPSEKLASGLQSAESSFPEGQADLN
jgi:hypothetical protein